ncbi:MAG: flagellar hook-basal body protein [candidate division FCPU426 bacterium]
MITGIYQSGAGLATLQQMQEIVAYNLANVSTRGFKQEVWSVNQTEPTYQNVTRELDAQAGPLSSTSTPTHLALAGEGYFTVLTPQGPAYTRNGQFHLDHQGRLVTREGFAVQGQNGDVTPATPEFTVTAAGEVVVNGEITDRLQIVNGSGPERRLGQTLVTWNSADQVQPLPPEKVEVLQGMLEGSNVDLVESMVNLLSVVRMYEANQQALQTQDSALSQALEAGKVRL